MKIEQVYICEYCHTVYSNEKDAERCEQTHTQHLKIEEVKYLGGNLDAVPFPIKIKVKSDTGEAYWYKRMHKEEEVKPYEEI